MGSEKGRRELAAILSAGVKGYRRLSEEDEEGTLRTLGASQELIGGLLQRYTGRMAGSAGERFFGLFSNVVDAVQCALAIREELETRNADLPENRRLDFRMGIHFGEVIEEGKDLHGEAVDIAVHVSNLAEGGGICVSGAVYDPIQNKLPLAYEYLGEEAV